MDGGIDFQNLVQRVSVKDRSALAPNVVRYLLVQDVNFIQVPAAAVE
jgi:hypothetical protein